MTWIGRVWIGTHDPTKNLVMFRNVGRHGATKWKNKFKTAAAQHNRATQRVTLTPRLRALTWMPAGGMALRHANLPMYAV